MSLTKQNMENMDEECPRHRIIHKISTGCWMCEEEWYRVMRTNGVIKSKNKSKSK